MCAINLQFGDDLCTHSWWFWGWFTIALTLSWFIAKSFLNGVWFKRSPSWETKLCKWMWMVVNGCKWMQMLDCPLLRVPGWFLKWWIPKSPWVSIRFNTKSWSHRFKLDDARGTPVTSQTAKNRTSPRRPRDGRLLREFRRTVADGPPCPAWLLGLEAGASS